MNIYLTKSGGLEFVSANPFAKSSVGKEKDKLIAMLTALNDLCEGTNPSFLNVCTFT